jgi:hypothetical protein
MRMCPESQNGYPGPLGKSLLAGGRYGTGAVWVLKVTGSADSGDWKTG